MDLVNISRTVFKWSLTLAPLSLLIVASNLFFPYIVGKHFIFRIFVLVALASWTTLLFYDARYRPSSHKLTWAYATYVLTLLISTILAENPSLSLWSNYERMDGLLNILFVFGYFLMLSSYIRLEGVWNILRVFLGISTFTALAGLWQFFTEDANRLDAVFGNAIYLAIFMVFHVAFALVYACKTSDKRVKYFLYATVPIAIFTMVHTSTRGAGIGFVLGVAAGSLYWSALNGKKKYLLTAAMVIVLFFASIFILRNTDFVMNSPALKRITHISSNEGSVSSRVNVWKIAKSTIFERPVLGWGIEGFNYGFNKYYIPAMYRFEPWFDRAHNMLLDILIWGGMLALIAYILLWLSFLLTLHKTDKLSIYEKSVLLGAVVAYAFHSMTVFDNLGSSIAIAIILAWLANYSGSLNINLPYKVRINKHVSYVVWVVLILIFVFTVYRPYIGNKHLLNGLRLSSTFSYGIKSGSEVSKELLMNSLSEFAYAFKYAPMYGTEITNQMVNASRHFVASGDQRVISEYFALTEYIALSVLKRDPYNMRVRLSLANLYTMFGFFDKAKEHFDFLLEYSPDRQLFLLSLANMELARDNNTDAIMLLKRAYELDRNQKRILKMIKELDKGN